MCDNVGVEVKAPHAYEPLDEVESRIWITWRELRRGPSLRRLAAVSYGHGEETTPDLTLVDMVEVIAANQPILMGELAGKLGIDNSTATRAMEKLEHRGFAHRARRLDDARRITVSLTAVGNQRCAEYVANRRRSMHFILQDFGTDDRERLAELLERLAVGLNKYVDSGSQE
jgi:DNA-binding MarR family transcriptional regulator